LLVISDRAARGALALTSIRRRRLLDGSARFRETHIMAVKLTINGTPQLLDAEPDMPLLWALRDIAGLRGTKFGCGRGLCGACTVHLNGRAVRSCSTPISRAAGQAVTTIEGLSPDGRHPVQLAWLEEDVPQCGYCQAGQIMAAAALLQAHPQPSDQEIRDGMSANLCRCGTYVRIRRAVRRAAALAAQRSTPAGALR
jgi:isoquinoline 1-oxidoreductase alpha subunit